MSSRRAPASARPQRPSEAVEAFRRATELEPERRVFYEPLIYILRSTGHEAEAALYEKRLGELGQ